MASLDELAKRFGYVDLGAAFPDAEIPVLTGMQRQGDVLVLPWTGVTPDEKWMIDIEGYVVVWGDNGHSHTLHGTGKIYTYRSIDDCGDMVSAFEWLVRNYVQTQSNPFVELFQGLVHVPDGAEAYLMHSDEHGAIGLGPGWYELRRQQEYVDGQWWAAGD